MPLPTRKTHALSHNRVSTPGATYFLTLTTTDRKSGLTSDSTANSVKEALRDLHRENAISFLCGTIMPDHIHLLATLGESLTLSQTIAKLKVVTKRQLQAVQLTWRRNYYDHHLRRTSHTDDFARYIFLNPYRRKLLSLSETWPHWLLNRDYRPEFLAQLNHSQTPPAAWLNSSLPLLDLIDSDIHP